MIVLVALVALLLYGLAVWRKERTSPLRKVPGPWYAPWTSLPLAYLYSRGTIWKHVQSSHQKYGDVVRLGPRNVWVAKPARDVFSKKTDFPKTAVYAELAANRHYPGLVGEIRNENHRQLRRLFEPAFTTGSVDALEPVFTSCLAALMDNYSNMAVRGLDGFDTDLMVDLHHLALDIIGETCFGQRFGQVDKLFSSNSTRTKEQEAWSKIPRAIFEGQARRYRTVFLKRFLRRFGWDMTFSWPQFMTQAITNLIDERQSRAKAGGQPVREDILHHFLNNGQAATKGDAGAPAGMEMNHQYIIDNMSEIFLTGSETSAYTMTCFCMEMARNPDVAEKLYASLPVLGPQDSLISDKSIRESENFEYLEACIKEVLRLHPVISELGRHCMRDDYEVDGYRLPKHTILCASVMRLQRHEKYWPQPMRFWPERWLSDEPESVDPSTQEAYMPFSHGNHACIGKRYAYAEMRTVLVNLFSRFRVTEVAEQKVDFRLYVTMQFYDNSWKAKLVPRWKCG
ncbi:hypothetical protein DCS_02704 [Drechmeria coniospora]|uniref:Cytochrome P450 n=1 Tax=Drechmeria coniospora TaxID=98403 RepID=A0A151GX03_DRECN|nr:hypothetical protein DCS_02704 [Drechmeria coniospora]KYK61562.1 hypothetical protein DCS_02704 [Drechmeria coniospora]